MKSNNIKKQVKCICCEQSNLKSIYKNKFTSPVNKEGLFKETIIHMSQLYCSYCEKITNVLSSDTDIISISEIPLIPLSAYNIKVFISESGLYGTFSLKENNKIISKEDLNELNILKLIEYLEYYNICFEIVDDDIIQFFFNKEKHKFLSNTSILNYIKNIFSNTGCHVSFGKKDGLLLDIFVSSEYFYSIIKQSEQLSNEERERLDPEYLEDNPKIIYHNNDKLSFLPILNFKFKNYNRN